MCLCDIYHMCAGTHGSQKHWTALELESLLVVSYLAPLEYQRMLLITEPITSVPLKLEVRTSKMLSL